MLVLLPLSGYSLEARFCGPYEVEKKLSDTDYVVKTPDRRKKARVCHVNMLKLHVVRDESHGPDVAPAGCAAPVGVVVSPPCCLEEDGLLERTISVLCARLENSKILGNLEEHLSYLSDPAQSDICHLIRCHAPIFGDKPTQTAVLQHDIDVGDHKPIKQHAYRVNPAKRVEMQREAEYLLENGLAMPSSSPWSSPSLLVPKPDQTFRFCNDYRKVNAITKPDSFPLPRMDDCVDWVGSAKYVTKLCDVDKKSH